MKWGRDSKDRIIIILNELMLTCVYVCVTIVVRVNCEMLK